MTRAAPVVALQALDNACVPAADAIACADYLRTSKRLRGWLDAFDAQVTTRLDALAAVGESFGSEDTHTRCSGISGREAAKLKNRSKTLDEADGFGDALADGAITAEHVDQLANAATKLDDELRQSLFGHADDLLNHASTHDPGRFGRHIRDLINHIERDAGIQRATRQRRHTHLSWTTDSDGMYNIHARLSGIDGAKLVNAIQAEVNARIARGEADGDPAFLARNINRGQIAADVLVDYVSGAHHTIRPTVADISLIIDIDTTMSGEHDHTVCETSHGVPLPFESVRTLLCNGTITPVIVDTDGVVLNLGRTTRQPNRAQKRALRAMYRTCAFTSCDVPFERCEIHHIHHWEHLGQTNLENLVPACSHHHHLIHQHNWHLDLTPSRILTVTDTHGQLVTTATPDMPPRGHPPRRQPGPATTGNPQPTHPIPLAG